MGEGVVFREEATRTVLVWARGLSLSVCAKSSCNSNQLRGEGNLSSRSFTNIIAWDVWVPTEKRAWFVSA